MTLNTSYGQKGEPLETRVKAIKILQDYYVTSPRIPTRLLSQLAAYKEKEARAFLDDVIARNPDRKIQANASQAMLNVIEGRASFGDRLKKDEKLRAQLEKTGGSASSAERIANAEPARREAERLRRILRERYADLPLLTIGWRMPELASEDLDGKTTQLSDLKGKVVVLDIWTTWCGPCKAMIPHEREMVARLKDKPFTLVSISFDEEKKTLVDFLAKEPMPWTNWWNGAEGKLKDTLNIQHYPTIFVLDPSGVIRYKEIRGEGLEKAVNTLLDEAKSKPAKAA